MINYSFIIPHFNSGRYLERLLSTIPDRCDIEIIVIDDGSNKKEKEIARNSLLKRKKSKITFIDNQVNVNAGKCRNQGVEYSNGKWLIFADADDLFTEYFINYLDEYLDSINKIIYFKVSSKLEESNRESSRHEVWNNLIDKYLYSHDTGLLYLHGVPWGKMILRDHVIKNNLFFDEIDVANDIMFNVRLGLTDPDFSIDERVLYIVMDHDSSLTKLKSKKNIHLRCTVWIDRYLVLKKNLSKKEFKKLNLKGKSVLNNVYRELGIFDTLKLFLYLIKKRISIF